MMELLSPAGNREALNAAIACGADAIYLGYTAFGARSFAGNFDADGLREAIDYAHERGKKIYVTVNTLIKQKDLQGAGEDGLCDVCEAEMPYQEQPDPMEGVPTLLEVLKVPLIVVGALIVVSIVVRVIKRRYF